MAKQSKRRTLRNRTRRNKKGGANEIAAAAPVAVVEPVVNAVPAAEGGKRKKTRKVSKGASDWNKKVMMVYHEMKKKNPATKLGDAMRECSKRKKRGEL
jgi:hypothetical protein